MNDKKLIKIARLFTKWLTNGNIDQKCHTISFPLKAYLSSHGVKCTIIHCEVDSKNMKKRLWGHICIELYDGRILDATAGQFKKLNLPKVYLGKLPDSYRILEHVL
jgi:hypothetical protein